MELDTPLSTSRPFKQRARYVVALVTAVLVGLAVLWLTREAVLLVFTGVALGALFYYASTWLAERVGGARGLWLGAIVVSVLGALAAASYFGAPSLLAQGQELIGIGPDVLRATEARLGLPDGALEIPEGAVNISSRALGIFSSLIGVVAGVIVILVVAVYTAASPQVYTEGFARFFDREHQPFVRRVLHRMGRTLLGWTRGVGIEVGVLTALGAVGLMIIGVPGGLALAVFAGALTAIPTFGPFIGWTPAVAVAFATDTTMGLWTLGLAVAAQQLEGSVITPKVQGHLVSVPPAVILATQIVLGSLTGFFGVFLAVPIAGVALVLVQELYIGPFVEGEGADPDTHNAPEAEVVAPGG